MSIAVNDEQPKTTCKYEATITPQGKDTWTVLIEDVKRFTTDPTVVYSRSTLVQRDKFVGTEEEVSAFAKDTIAQLVADRDAMSAIKQFVITEDDVNG